MAAARGGRKREGGTGMGRDDERRVRTLCPLRCLGGIRFVLGVGVRDRRRAAADDAASLPSADDSGFFSMQQHRCTPSHRTSTAPHRRCLTKGAPLTVRPARLADSSCNSSSASMPASSSPRGRQTGGARGGALESNNVGRPSSDEETAAWGQIDGTVALSESRASRRQHRPRRSRHSCVAGTALGSPHWSPPPHPSRSLAARLLLLPSSWCVLVEGGPPYHPLLLSWTWEGGPTLRLVVISYRGPPRVFQSRLDPHTPPSGRVRSGARPDDLRRGTVSPRCASQAPSCCAAAAPHPSLQPPPVPQALRLAECGRV